MLGKDEVIEEVSQHIEICHKYDEGFSQMKLDALEAILFYLKDQEPVEPMATITDNGIHHDFCGKCGRLLPIGQAKFCSYCGRAVKWE